MKFDWPQVIYVGMMLIGMGISIAKHGEYKHTSKYNAWSLFIAYTIDILILAWGGFFS